MNMNELIDKLVNFKIKHDDPTAVSNREIVFALDEDKDSSATLEFSEIEESKNMHGKITLFRLKEGTPRMIYLRKEDSCHNG